MGKLKLILIPIVFAAVITATVPLTTGESTSPAIHVAVASNFTDAIVAIAERYKAKTGTDVRLLFGSTGKHYAQIKNGAPFDVFFAADRRRPKLLESERVAVPGSRFTYAVGKVVLWSPEKNFVDARGRVLYGDRFDHLAIANPRLAPYGKAAEEVLRAYGIWDKLGPSLVRGDNISQTFQFVKSGNARLGFVAYSQVKRPGLDSNGSIWVVPQKLYTPIEQQAVLLRDNDIARDFLQFVRGSEAKAIIHEYGYTTP